MFIKRFEEFDADDNLYLSVDEVKESLKDLPALSDIIADEKMIP